MKHLLKLKLKEKCIHFKKFVKVHRCRAAFTITIITKCASTYHVPEWMDGDKIFGILIWICFIFQKEGLLNTQNLLT